MRFVRNPPPDFSGSGEAIGDWEIFYHLFDGIDPADRKATPGCIGYHIGTLEKDGLGHGLVTCLDVLQEFAFHGLSFLRYALVTRVASPAVGLITPGQCKNGMKKAPFRTLRSMGL